MRTALKTLRAATLFSLYIPLPLMAVDPSVDLTHAPTLGVPVTCSFQTGEQCWLANFFDHNPGEAIEDFRCLGRTYNAETSTALAHKGTDFAALDWRYWHEHAEDLQIIASAPGTVVVARDGIIDARFRHSKPTKTPCGNYVAIDHGHGWKTHYCHLKKGSVQVAIGEEISKGQTLGLMGSSGQSSFPHLHFSVGFTEPVSGKTLAVDPFSGTSELESCSAFRQLMWDPEARDSLGYNRIHVIKMGFAGSPMSEEEALFSIRSEPILSWQSHPKLSLFIYFAGALKGDHVRFRVFNGTNEVVFHKSLKLKIQRDRQVLQSVFAGAKAFETLQKEDRPLPTGKFQFVVDFADQQGHIFQTHRRSIEIVP